MQRVLLAVAALLAVTPDWVCAQQGSAVISGSAQVLTGDPQQLGGQHRFEPDFGVWWVQPGFRFGNLELELRGTRRYDLFHLGRTHASLRDVKFAGATWTFEGGDSYRSSPISDYRFSNLFTPTVTFSGGTGSARTNRSSLDVVLGRATALRNIFGGDPDSLAQTIAAVRGTHRPQDRLDVNVRASRIRTSSLREFAYTVAASDQVGGGLKYELTSDLQLVADGSFVRYERVGTSGWTRDGSGLVGANWLHSRGWVQVNASRFSPGDMPTLNSPLPDRAGIFTAGEYDLHRRIRVLGGWEFFRTNLDPASSASSPSAAPRTTGSRQFAAVRLQIGGRSMLTLRAEDGDRVSRPILSGFESESDTGSWTAEWQAAVSRINGFARYTRRENVDRLRTDGSYTQDDASVQIFARVGHFGQVFGLATLTKTDQTPGGSTYWQAGAGAQMQMNRRSLWLRTEATISRNLDVLTDRLSPRESFNVGLSGQMTPGTSVGINFYIDRAAPFAPTSGAWSTRSMFRVTRSFRTGSARVPSATNLPPAMAERGTGAIRGLVFADWNGNGVRDPEDNPVGSIPLRVMGATQAITGRAGYFAFQNVPAGLRDVGLDLGALPVDFDPPPVPEVQVDVTRDGTVYLAFGLIPLGAIQGKVVRDVNGNNTADPDDPAVDGAVIVLDSGVRSEQSRKGAFSFNAVRSGAHTVGLLIDSLPAGAVVAGPAEQNVTLGRENLTADVLFLVSIGERPEIRRVFPGGRGGGKPQPPIKPVIKKDASDSDALVLGGGQDETDGDRVGAASGSPEPEDEATLPVPAASPATRNRRPAAVHDTSEQPFTMSLESQFHFDVRRAAGSMDRSDWLDREEYWRAGRSSRGGCKLHRGYRRRRRVTYVKIKRLR